MPSLPTSLRALRPAALALLALTLTGCERPAPSPAEAPAVPGAASSPAAPASPALSGSSGHTTVSSAPASAAAASVPAIGDREFGAMVTGISEVGGKFPSDNYVSNETSYLDVTGDLGKHRGGAYIGVGPEQNFTYLALLEPEVAFVIDIRRENMLLQLVYKALFEREATRAGFVAGLTSRAVPAGVADDAPVEKVMEAVQQAAPDAALEAALVKAVTARALALGVPLSSDDERSIREALDAFRKQGPAIHYTMEKSARHYPSLAALMAQRDDQGQLRSFLGTREAYERVRRMQQENRVVPLVGDLGGDGALTRLGAELRKRHLDVHVFYTSNVEQYLFEPRPWAAWVRNLDALPWDADAVLVRVYFDQGRAHPLQRPGHRTTSMVRPVKSFLDRAHHGGWRSWWEVAQ